MTVTVFSDRKALVLQWDKGTYEGPVTIKTVSANDVSETNLVSNPGYAAVTFPLDYSGSLEAKVLDADGGEIDAGEVSVS